jgi:hypothetical protein
MTAPDDEFTELVDAHIDRVDLVGKSANGTEFLVMKARSEGRGLFEADIVRDLISKSDAQEGTMTAPVTKADGIDSPVDDVKTLDVSEVLAEPAGTTAAGMDTDPASPAWEAVDAATAQKWTAIAVRLKNAIEVLANRESVESSSENGDYEDGENSWDLEDAACAVDFAISVLAPYAIGEQAEADMGTESLQVLAKSMAGFDAAPLEVIEGLAPVMKAGKVISSANLAKINTAIESLQSVVASMPDAPDQSVAKSKEPTVTTPTIDDLKAVTAELVTKAKGDPLTPVYDESGKLIAMVDSVDLIPIASPSGDVTDPADAAPDPTDSTPADPASVGTPADATAPAPVPVDPAAVAKSTEEIFKSLLDERVKEARDEWSAEVSAIVKGLEDRLTAWEEKPARPGVLTNGATPPELQPVAKADETIALLRKQAASDPDPTKRESAASALSVLTNAAFAAMTGH